MIESNSKRIVENTVFLYMRMLFVMLINILSVRFVLKGLGVVDYGIFNVVAGLVTMFHSLSNVVASATLRFHSYYIGEGNEKKVSDVFSASINIYALLSVCIFIMTEALGLWFINTQMELPAERLTAANMVYQFAIGAFIVSLMTTPYSSIIFAYERMKAFSIISVCECILKFLLALSLLYLTKDHLIIYGLGLFVISIVTLLTNVVVSSKSGKCHYVRKVEGNLYKQMLSFSGWTLFSSTAGISINYLVTMVTNVFFGPIVNAARAIAFQINSAMNSFTGNIIMAIKPPMIKIYAEGDYDKVDVFFQFCNKAVYFCLLFVVMPIFFEMETVLKLWLGVEDAQTTLFSRLILIYALIVSLNNPIAIIIQATGKIRAYSTYVEIPTLLCFPITWLLYYLHFPAETAFYVMIVAILISHIIRLICLKRLFPVFSYRKYIGSFIIPASMVTIIVAVTLAFIHSFMVCGLMRLIVVLLVGTLLIIITCLAWGLSKEERKLLFDLLNIKNILHKGK